MDDRTRHAFKRAGTLTVAHTARSFRDAERRLARRWVSGPREFFIEWIHDEYCSFDPKRTARTRRDFCVCGPDADLVIDPGNRAERRIHVVQGGVHVPADDQQEGLARPMSSAASGTAFRSRSAGKTVPIDCDGFSGHDVDEDLG
jgi:hypothetical protein